MVKKLELAVSLEFTSQPRHSPPTSFSPSRSLILHTKRNVIITKWGSYGVENVTRLYDRNGRPRTLGAERISRGGEPHFANPGVSGLKGSRMRVRGGAIAQRVHLIVLAAR
jgi:hypothetical protein